MPSIPISQLPPVSEVSPSAYVPLDQNGVTSRATVQQIGAAAQALTQSFLTVGSESGTLPNSRAAGAANGITKTDSGAGGTLTFSLTGQALNFFLLSTTGLTALTGGGNVASRSLVGPGKGFTISNADGVAGNPTFALSGGLLALEDLTGPGVVCSTGADTFSPRTLTGTANQITVTEGQGAGGDPTFSIADDPRLPGTAGFLPPGGTTAQRPLSPPVGFTRRNTDLNVLEAWDGAQWVSQGVAGVTSVGAEGQSGITVTGSPITSSGTFTISLDDTAVTPGAYGSASAVPVVTVDQQGRITDATTAAIAPADIGAVPTSRTVSAGSNLTGGGALSSDITLALAGTVSGVTYASPTITGDISQTVSAQFGGHSIFNYSGSTSQNTAFRAFGARGTSGAPSAVQDGDAIADFIGLGRPPSGSWANVGLMRIEVDGAPSGSAVNGRLLFLVGNSGALNEALRVRSDGTLAHASNAVVIVDPSSLLSLRSYTVSTLPTASPAGRMCYVSNGGGSRRLAVADGSAWRWTDGTPVSTLGAQGQGVVRMWVKTQGGNDPNINPATWVVQKPDGSFLDTTGTTTMGLQEAITYAIGNGYDLIVEGGAVKGTAPSGVDGSIIHCTTAISFPPMQKGYVSIRGTTINFDGTPAGSPYGITFDSMMMARVEFPGSQIVAYASAYAGAVKFSPTTALPIDNVAVITDSVIDLCTTVAYPGKTCVTFDASAHGISSNRISVMEPNGGAVGVQVLAGTGSSFDDNRVDITDAHLQTTTCVAVGNGTTGATSIFGNVWTIGCDPATGATGVSIYGTCDKYQIAVRNEEGTPAVGIALQTSADQNVIDTQIIEANAKVTDSSSSKSNAIKLPRDIAICNRGNVDQSGIAASTWTTIQFTAAPRNTLGSFDTSTYRFTASVPGFYRIDAQASFTTIGDQTPIGIGTWLTGVQSKQAFATASGTDSNVSIGISQVAYLDTGAYVEIKVFQNSGGTLTLSGDNKRTAAYFERID